MIYTSGSQTFFTDDTLKLFNIIAGIPDSTMYGSFQKKKVVNETQFITHTFSVKHGMGALCIYLGYWDKFETDTQEILTVINFSYY
jgi:hypothetical protein